MPGSPRSIVCFCSLFWVSCITHAKASEEEVRPREKTAGRDVQADDNPMTEGNYMIVACINALKLIRLSKHFCGSAYLHPQHLLHELSYEQKPVTQILMTKKVLVERLV